MAENYAIAGRVSIVPKGEWDMEKTYQRLDLVTYRRKAYLSKKTSVGYIPTDGDAWMFLFETSGIATETDAGIVIPDNLTILIDGDGEISVQGMVGATETEDGKAGLVPKPTSDDRNKALFGDGTYKEVTIDVDSEMSDTSKNPVQNKVVKAAIENKLSKTGDSKDNTVSFSTATSRTNIVTGEKHSTLFGKIAKYFTDMKSFCFNSLVTSLATRPSTGYAVDAATVYNAFQDVTSNTSISDAYSSTKTYAVGDYCIYNKSLYNCKVDCTGQVPTNTTYWTKVSVMEEMKSKKVRVESLLLTHMITQDVTLSTYLGRSIDDYGLLVFYVGVPTATSEGYAIEDIRDTKIVHKSLFKEYKSKIKTTVIHGGHDGDINTYSVSSMNFEYVSDTSIKVTIGESKVVNGITVLGIKY